MAIKCEACGNRYYDSVVRECPKKPGHFICMYCCGKCKRRYAKNTSFGCKAADEAKQDERDSEVKT